MKLLDAAKRLAPAGPPPVSEQGEPALPPTAITRPSEAERRQLTVMFADLVGSTALSQRLDPEDLRLVNRAYQEASTAAIERFDGYVARYTGDGVLAYFGYPVAHEDDAERAVRAGLSLLDAVRDIDVADLIGREEELEARVGIATGPTVVGDLIGQGIAQERAAVGETPNLAARIEAAAPANSVVVSPATFRLTGSLFSFESLGQRDLKGMATTVELWRVVDTQRVQSRFRALHRRALTPLVGRDDELQMLLRRWRAACGGEGHAVLISGEAGIGKSRLTEAVRDHAGAEHHIWLGYQCSPHETNTPFHPFSAQLGYAAGIDHARDEADKLHRLRALLGRAPGTSENDVEVVAALLGLVRADDAADVSPEARKRRIIDVLLGQFRRLSRTAPVLCVFEDLHWTDPSTLELLDELMGSLEGHAALVLVTSRPEFVAPWMGQACTTVLTLGRMGLRDSVRMVESAFHETKVPAREAESIAKRADGIPLFIEELAQAAVEDAVQLAATPDAPGEHETHAFIPDTLHDVLMARLDRSPNVRDVAQLAAVIGRDFDYSLLTAAASRSAAEVRRAVELLVDAGLIQMRGHLPQARCRFKHALIRDAAYAMLTRQRRMAMHAAVAGVLRRDEPGLHEASPTPSVSPELIAHHLSEAGDGPAAVEYWSAAGERALRGGGQPEAAAHFANAIRLLQPVDGDAEHRRMQLSLLLRLGQAQFGAIGGAAPETIDTYRWSVLLALLLRDPARARRATDLLRSHTDRSGGRFWRHFVLWGTGGADVLEGRAAPGVVAMTDGLRGYMATGGLQQVPLSQLLVAEAHLSRRDYDQCFSTLDEAERVIADTEQRFFEAELHRVRGAALASAGRPSEAEERFTTAIEVAEKQRHLAWQLRACTSLARLWGEQGRREEAVNLVTPVCESFTEGFGTVDLKDARALLREFSQAGRARPRAARPARFQALGDE